jgi:aryl-alcohol dehydrogenase-like predicted oxidoreductase
MKSRSLGRTAVNVSEIGFGAWAIGGGWGPQDDADSLATLHAALDAGVNFIDTAAGYGNGRSERLIAQALHQRGSRDRQHIYVATKTPPTSGDWPPSPYCRWQDRYSEQHLRGNVEERLRNLNVECLDLLQLHTWTRAWNVDPQPLLILAKLRDEGKIRHIGVSTPEHDQNCVIDLMRAGLLDAVQVIYNIFEQEPAAQLLPVAQQCNVGIIVRVAFDEGALTGKFTNDTRFADGDFRQKYFEGDRLPATVRRVEAIRQTLAGSPYSMPQAALKFCLTHPAVSTVIAGMRNVQQARENIVASDLPDIDDDLMTKLRGHAWRRGFWYGGN